MNFDPATLNFIQKNSLIEIKAGKERTTFLEIWMVVVDGRIFARSWGLAAKSWYNTFLDESLGQIKVGERIWNIQASIPKDVKEITAKINQAYLDKYCSAENIDYAKGIIQQKHMEKTMEFKIV